MNSFENPQNKTESQELKPAKIALHFFRHSIKESNDVTLPNDEIVKLSQEGKDLAIEKSFDDVNLSQAVAFGSPRIRTQETAGFMMAGNEDDIIGNESLDELREKVDKDLKIGSKIGIDKRLNFNDPNDMPVGRANNEAYSRGEYVKHIVEKSDKLSKETGDNFSETYSYKASQIAKIIDKYVNILPRWQKLVNDSKKNYTESLERYLATHLGMGESFLAKVIEVTDGREARDEFIEMIGHNGFDYLEGFEVDIQESNGEKNILIRYKTGKGTIVKELSFNQLETVIQR